MSLERISSALQRKPFFCDARFISTDSLTVGIKDGEQESKEGASEGLCVRAFIRGSWGFAAGAPADFEYLLSRAERLARASPGNSKYPRREGEPVRPNNCKKPLTSDAESMLSTARELYSEMEGEKISNRQVRLSEVCIFRAYANSAGAMISESYLKLYSHFICIGKNGNVRQEGHHSWGSRTAWDMDALFFSAREAKRKCLGALSASPPPHGIFTAVLDNEMAGVFAHEAVGHACEGDAILEGTSLLAGKKGMQLGSELVNIWDSPAHEGEFGSYEFDDEGMAGKAVCLIHDGRLNCFLHSAESAESLGDEPNGHARAEDFSVPPLVRMSNTYIAPGDHSIEELMEISKGIYVKGMNGGSVDTLTGQYMFRAEEAFLISNGAIGERVRDLSITGTIIGTLREVDAVGNDLRLKPGFCSKNGQTINVSDGGPHIRIKSIKVG